MSRWQLYQLFIVTLAALGGHVTLAALRAHLGATSNSQARETARRRAKSHVRSKSQNVTKCPFQGAIVKAD